MGRLSSRVGYWSAGLALVLVVALLGVSGHGLPALGMQMLNGEAWLANTANRSISLINGYSGKMSGQAGQLGVSGNLQVVNTPGGAVVAGQNGRMVEVSNDNFTAANPVPDPVSGPIVLVGGGAVTTSAGQDALYAVDQATGKIQQLNPASPQLPAIGSPVSVGRPVSSPVVAPDGSLYVAIGSSGDVGHVMDGNLVLIKDVGRPRDRLAVVLAGSQVVAADLSQGIVMPLGPTAVSGPGVRLPASFRAAQMTGSDISNGLVGLISAHAVYSVNVTTRAASPTALSPAFSATASAMQGHDVVLINSTQRKVVVVDTAAGQEWTWRMPGSQPPDQITVRDRLVFVNASNGASAMVINGSHQMAVTKYTGPAPTPRKKPVQFPAAAPAKISAPASIPVTPHRKQTPHRPGAPLHPAATAGNASATVNWGAAAANGSAVKNYLLTWSQGNGSPGQKTVPGTTLGTTVTGLANGTSYVFTVAAVNSVGQGPSASTSSVTPSSSVPDAPTGVTATATAPDGSVELSWSAPDNGYHIASYTITEAGTGAQVQTGVTGTSAIIGPTPGLVVVGDAVQFEVTAISTSGQSSAPSAPSGLVTPYEAPGAPEVAEPTLPTSGTSATLTVSCDATCQEGRPAQTYQVTLSPAGPVVAPVTAAADGAATTVQLTGLTPNASYTASVTVTDSAGATGPPDVVTLAMPGPPTVSSVKVSAGSGLALDVTATVGGGAPGEDATCGISVSGAGTGSGACGGTISVNVSTYNTSYTVTFTATNASGSTSGTGTGTSGLKSLTANATDAFGTCAQYPKSKWCGADSGVEPTAAFTTSLGPVSSGATMTASCWANGGIDYGNVPPYNQGSTTWVHVTNSPGPGYMSILWFPDPDSVTSGLPSC